MSTATDLPDEWHEAADLVEAHGFVVLPAGDLHKLRDEVSRLKGSVNNVRVAAQKTKVFPQLKGPVDGATSQVCELLKALTTACRALDERTATNHEEAAE
jgi:hypothetical protein